MATNLRRKKLLSGWMSGFSSEMLKLFLDDEDITPYTMMLKAVRDYEVFVVDE